MKCNPQFAALFAYQAEELVGHSSAIWFLSVENWQIVGNEANAVAERGEPYEFEQEFVRKNGERIWCRVAGRILDPHNWARLDLGLHRHHRGQAARKRGVRRSSRTMTR